jgi:putative ABC transport system permease protein
MLGLGSKSFSILSSILILIAILSIFSGLASNLDNRKGDLAILRAIGYSKIRIFKIISLEGVIIVTIGIIIGLIISILGFRLLTELVPPLQTSNAILIFDTSFTIVILLVLLSGFIAACLPAYRGAKISVANQLSRNI